MVAGLNILPFNFRMMITDVTAADIELFLVGAISKFKNVQVAVVFKIVTVTRAAKNCSISTINQL